MTYCKKKNCIHYDVCAFKACKFVCPYYKCNTSTAKLDKMPMISKEHKDNAAVKSDLISRDSIIKTIQNKFNEFDFDTEYHEGLRDGYLNAIYAIEDARPVSFIISPDYVTELQNLNKKLAQLLEKEQPRGEWSDLSVDGRHTGWIYCTVCGHEPPNGSNLRTDFCPNCGADLRRRAAKK